MIDEPALRRAFADLQRRVAYLEKMLGLFVPDDELDQPGGDPRVKFMPNKWLGDNFKDCFFSECTPEFLEVLAETLSWMADNPKEGKEKYASYNRKDAAKARSWARRIRARQATPAPALPAPPTTNVAAVEPSETNYTPVVYDPATGVLLDDFEFPDGDLDEFEFEDDRP